MKKTVTAAVCMVLVFLLCGCNLKNLKNVELPPLPEITETPAFATNMPTFAPAPEAAPIPSAVPTPLPTPVPTPLPTPEPTPEPLYAGFDGQLFVSVKRTQQDSLDPENGTACIASFVYETPVVSIEGRDAAAAAINSELAMRSEQFYTGSEKNIGFYGLQEMAEDHYAYLRQSEWEEDSFTYRASRTVSVARADKRMLSLVFSEYEDNGTSTPGYGTYGLVFDTETGKVLTLEELSTDWDKLRAELVLNLVRSTEADESLYDHLYVTYVPNGDFFAKLGQLLRPGAWYFDEKGLTFVSELYELGPYVAGLCSFTLSYDVLKDSIDPRWLPEESTAFGSLSVAETASIPAGTTAFVDRVEASAGGKDFSLLASGTVSDLSIASVHYDNGFVQDGLLWYCSELKDAAVQLIAELPQGMPQLQIRYKTQNGQSVTRVLTYSEAGTAAQLKNPAEVQPVG